MALSEKPCISCREDKKRPTAKFAALAIIAGLFAMAMPAVAGCVYPTFPPIDSPVPPPQLNQDGIIGPGPTSFVGNPTNNGYAYQVGCVILDPPPLPPPCSPEQNDCFPPIDPPDFQEPGRHDTNRNCAKQPMECSNQVRKANCGYRPTASFNTSLSMQVWAS